MNSEQQVPHIGFICPENIPDVIVEDLLKSLDSQDLHLLIRRTPPSIYNSFEWAFPGIIAAYILKPYFESFLKEAGKDHYIALNKWLKDLVKKARSIKVHTISAAASSEKLDPHYSQSKSISIYCQTKDARMLKLLFDETLSEGDCFIARLPLEPSIIFGIELAICFITIFQRTSPKKGCITKASWEL
jgi:hypothetical protein